MELKRLIRHPARLLRRRVFAFLAILGPGFITANVDNDPGGILTYSQAGAKFGYALLWTLIPITIALIVIQEMVARMGAVTGKGLHDLIREEFGLRATFFVTLVFVSADIGNIAAEFAGIASGLGIFGVSKYLSVPLGALLVWALILYGRYKPVERILLLFSLVYFTYAGSAILAHPDWTAAVRQTLIPEMALLSSDYLMLVVGLIGTTITPWMQFYLQASIVEKGISVKKYWLSKWDVIIGCVVTNVVAFFIMVACGATLFPHGTHDIADAADAAVALKPLAGRFASVLFAIGLVNAALLSAAILPLATTYNVCEGLGFESGLNKRFSEAPTFYTVYTVLIVFGAGVVLIPHMPLIKLILLTQVGNGIVLPFLLFYILKLVNRADLMGDYKNSRLANIISAATSITMIVLTLAMILMTIAGA